MFLIYPIAGTAAHHDAVIAGVVEASVDKGSGTIGHLASSDSHALLHHGVAYHGGLDGHGGGDPVLPVLHGRGEGGGWRKAFLSCHHYWASGDRSALWQATCGLVGLKEFPGAGLLAF